MVWRLGQGIGRMWDCSGRLGWVGLDDGGLGDDGLGDDGLDDDGLGDDGLGALFAFWVVDACSCWP